MSEHDSFVTPNTATSSRDRLQEIRARLDAATPGPWRSRPRSNETSHTIYRGRLEIAWTVYAQEDADLVANAPTDLAWCLTEIERLERENADDLLEITRKASDAEDYWMQEAKRLAAEVERLRGLAACPDCDYMDGGKPCVYCAAVHKKGAA